MVSNEPGRTAQAAGGAAPPVAAMVENIVGCKWSLQLLALFVGGQRRPSELLRASPGLSAKVMNERLRKMQRFGIVRRTVFGDKPPIEVEYLLTPFGRRFIGIVDEVQRLQAALDSGSGDGAGEAPPVAAVAPGEPRAQPGRPSTRGRPSQLP